MRGAGCGARVGCLVWWAVVFGEEAGVVEGGVGREEEDGDDGVEGHGGCHGGIRHAVLLRRSRGEW